MKNNKCSCGKDGKCWCVGIDKDYPYDIKDINWLSNEEMCNIFKAIGDKIRFDILIMIYKKPGIIGKEILADMKMSQPALSFHIKQLKEACLIADVRDGQTHKYFTNYKLIICFYFTLMRLYGSFANKIEDLYLKAAQTIKKINK